MMNGTHARREFAVHVLTRLARSPMRIIVTAIMIGCVVSLSHWRWAMHPPRHLPHSLVVILGSVISGAAVSGLAGAVLWLHHQRQRVIARHARDILQLNHHVRNAMQVIAYSQSGAHGKQATTVSEALNRIGEALRTISSSAAPVQPTTHNAVRAFQVCSRVCSVEALELELQAPAQSRRGV